ncbi:MAG: ABC transporter substrate-binding protein [Ruminococcaceae bacterium]|nr:ABC transporter substrate-binding protein [Oscillospiraceae bacterium]
MKTWRRPVALLAALILMMGLAGCGGGEDQITVRYLNFKPEIAGKYEELAREYEKATGVRVMVDTAANNTYEQTLTARMASPEAPTLFQINGPRGYAAWKDYCADLSGTELYKHLTDKSLAITDGNKVVGIPYVVEGYGIIYNKAITDRYFALKDRSTAFTSMEQITSYDKLSSLVQDMQKRRTDLGIEGVFASTSLKSGEDWRWQTHLMNLPVYYELQGADLTGEAVKNIDFRHADRFRAVFDLYTNHSVTDKSRLGTKTVGDSMAEFALEQCAMVQNGNWAWSQIDDVPGNKVEEENVRFLPIYGGFPGEESQGLCIGTENYYAINAKASAEEQKAAADFIYWLYSSEMGKDYVTDEFGFIAPFDTFTDEDTPDDPLAQEVRRWMDNKEVESVPWQFTLFPSAKFKEDLGASLLKYAQGTKSFEDVKADAVRSWKEEYAATR